MDNTLKKKHKIDPRIVRTRRLLLEAFSQLLDEESSVRRISIQKITERAGVNRVTFYAHFTDKDELLSEWKREVFRGALSEHLRDDQEIQDITFAQLVSTLLDFMASYKKYFSIVNKEYKPLFDAALQRELKSIITIMLEKRDLVIAVEATATFLGWAIFGSADAWRKQSQPKEKVSEQLLGLIDKTLAH